jgi:hypothetical protein
MVNIEWGELEVKHRKDEMRTSCVCAREVEVE